MDKQYFANLPGDELIQELTSRVDSYYNWLIQSGRLTRWRIAYSTYYGTRGSHKSWSITSGGDKGELSFLMSNEYGNLVQHLMALATQSRPALEPVCENTDSESKAGSYVAKGIVEYYRRNADIDKNSYKAAEMALIFDTAWVVNQWDFLRGPDVAAGKNGNIVKAGDIYSRARTPIDVIVDFMRLESDVDWIIIRDPVNKFDVAAQYPEKADELLAIQRELKNEALFKFGDLQYILWEGITTSDIDRYTFFHRKTPACPQGRVFEFFGNKTWTLSAPIPYRKLPGNRICPTEMILSNMGYSRTNDLLSLQDTMDALISAAVTNMTTCGVNNIWTKPGSNFNMDQIASGMNHIESEEKPEVLVTAKLPPEWMSLTNFIIQRMEALSGINSVARGNIEQKDLSGAAMALLQSMAIQFNSGFQHAVNQLIEDNGNDVLMLTQDYVDEGRLGMIVGLNNRYQVKSYKGSDMSKVKRLYMRQSNPLKDTTAGKLTIAQDLIKMGCLKDPGPYLEILDTGNIDVLTESPRNDRLTVDMENEALVRGEDVPVIFCDKHPDHINGHKKLFASPEDRQDVGLIQRVSQHIQEHIKTWTDTDPNILASLGIPPVIPQPMPPPGGMPGQPGPQGPQPAPQPGMRPGAPKPEPGSPPGGHPTKPKPPPQAGQPGLVMNKDLDAAPAGGPRNPLSGQKWNPQTGGLPQ